MNEKMIYLVLIALILSNAFFIHKYFKRKRKKNRRISDRDRLNVTTASSKSNAESIKAIVSKCDNAFVSIQNRLDKLEVDSAYIKDFSIKSAEVKKESTIIPNPSNIEKKPLFFSKAIRPKKKKKSKLFNEKEIDTEMRSHIGDILFLTPTEYKKEYDKAYGRLYYKYKTKNK